MTALTLAAEDRGFTIIYSYKRTGRLYRTRQSKDSVRKKKNVFQNLCGCLVEKTRRIVELVDQSQVAVPKPLPVSSGVNFWPVTATPPLNRDVLNSYLRPQD